MGPPVEVLDSLVGGLRGMEEAPEHRLGGVGDGGVQRGVRPDGCEESDGPGRGRRHVLAPGGRGPAEAVRGVAEVGRVVEVDRAELAAGVLGLGPEHGGRGDDEGGALRCLEGSGGQFEAVFPEAELDLRHRVGQTGVDTVSTRTSERGSGLFRSRRGEHRFDGSARRGSRERSDIWVLLRQLGLGLVRGGAGGGRLRPGCGWGGRCVVLCGGRGRGFQEGRLGGGRHAGRSGTRRESVVAGGPVPPGGLAAGEGEGDGQRQSEDQEELADGQAPEEAPAGELGGGRPGPGGRQVLGCGEQGSEGCRGAGEIHAVRPGAVAEEAGEAGRRPHQAGGGQKEGEDADQQAVGYAALGGCRVGRGAALPGCGGHLRPPWTSTRGSRGARRRGSGPVRAVPSWPLALPPPVRRRGGPR
ncbi:hypothetical protein EES44_28415 [Streptomyces sp. ADI96-15]|nr:hypothetical protein EES44_28415 [Streptomyces sp. ADI96-15]